MKSKLIIVSILAIITSNLSGQDSTTRKAREFYIALTDISPFSFQIKYKKQINTVTFYRIGLVNLSAHANNHDGNSGFPVQQHGFSAGLELGIEHRRSLTERFALFHGPNILYSYDRSEATNFDPTLPVRQKNKHERHLGALPYTLGILFNVSANILIAAEVNPSISYNYSMINNGPGVNNNSSGINFNINNRFGILSIVYRP